MFKENLLYVNNINESTAQSIILLIGADIGKLFIDRIL